jgi:hypothetical protein
MDLISSIGMDGYQHIVGVDLQEVVVVIYFNTSRNHSPRRGWSGGLPEADAPFSAFTHQIIYCNTLGS